VRRITLTVMTPALTLLLFSLAANAQVQSRIFSFYADNDLGGGAENCTVQKPSSQVTAQTDFISATFYAEAATTIILEVGFTTALDTNGDIVSMTAGDPVNEAFCSSEVAQGDIIYVYDLAAGEKVSIDLSTIHWPATTGGRTLTLRHSNVTGIVRRNIVWSERSP